MRIVAAALAAILGTSVAAQDFSALPLSPAQSQSGILLVDVDEVFAKSQFGLELRSLVETESAALQAENDKLQGELEAEVADLTAKRSELSPEEFRVLADAFDQKVQAIRASQDEKEAALNNFVQLSRERFVSGLGPVLQAQMRERGAEMVLDAQLARVFAPNASITADAISAVNALMMQGELQVPQFKSSGSLE